MADTIEAPPRVLRNRGIRSFISGEQGNKSLKLKGTGEQRQFWGTGNIENQDFDFGEQGNRYLPPPPPPPTPREGLIIIDVQVTMPHNPIMLRLELMTSRFVRSCDDDAVPPQDLKSENVTNIKGCNLRHN